VDAPAAGFDERDEALDISLNNAGSSRLSTWPDFGKKVSAARQMVFQSRLGPTQASSSSPEMIKAGSRGRRIAAAHDEGQRLEINRRPNSFSISDSFNST